MKTPSPQLTVSEEKPGFGWVDGLVMAVLFGLLWSVLHFGKGMLVHFDPADKLKIDSSASMIPYYAGRTLLRIGKEFGETIAMVKAAEILELVDTPKQDIFLTDLGRKFMETDRLGQRTIFAEQVCKLRIFHIILALLNECEVIEAERLIKDIASALPYDNPEKTFEIMIAWGRYAGLMDFNTKTRTVFIPKDGDALENVAA